LVDRFTVKNTVFQKNDLELAPGVYSVLVKFDEGIANKKLVIVE